MKSSENQITTLFNKVAPNQKPPQFSNVWGKYEQQKRGTFFGNKKIQLAMCVAVIFLFTTGFGFYQLYWANQEITISSSKEDLSEMITPLETFQNLREIHGDVITPIEAVAKAPWFHIQSDITGWEKVDSFASGFTGELSLYDFYRNEAGEKIVVMQSYDQSMTTSLNHVDTEQHVAAFRQQFPHGSLIVNEFGNDLAVLMDLQQGRYSLIVYKEVNQDVYSIVVWGNGDADQMKEIAKLYYGSN